MNATAIATATATYDPRHETTLTHAVLKVISNMGRKVLAATGPNPLDHDDLDDYRSAMSNFEKKRAEMMRSYVMAMNHIATPGIRLWPDHSGEHCLSLSGQMSGISFGLIFHPDAGTDTGTWSFHS